MQIYSWLIFSIFLGLKIFSFFSLLVEGYFVSWYLFSFSCLKIPLHCILACTALCMVVRWKEVIFRAFWISDCGSGVLALYCLSARDFWIQILSLDFPSPLAVSEVSPAIPVQPLLRMSTPALPPSWSSPAWPRTASCFAQAPQLHASLEPSLYLRHCI